jgi:hypothetical protein
MRPRTGTHFLANLLCQHPDCVKSPLAEDALLSWAHLLARYVTRTNEQWTEVAGEPHDGYEDLLFQSLGEGLTSFLHSAKAITDEERLKKFGGTRRDDPASRRLVTKTPGIDNLEHFFKLFPEAHLLIIIRDGRAVVESEHRSFKSDRERSTRAWAKAAQRLIRFETNPPVAKEKYMIVRYEDLHANTETEILKILDFLGLDSAKYDFQTALNLPVVGSSTFKRQSEKLSWLPVSKTPDFDPLNRAGDWTRAQHERFNWLAGRELERLGYAKEAHVGNQRVSAMRNMLLDLAWAVWLRKRLKTGAP